MDRYYEQVKYMRGQGGAQCVPWRAGRQAGSATVRVSRRHDVTRESFSSKMRYEAEGKAVDKEKMAILGK